MKSQSAWIVGATTLVGVGVGLVFLQTSALYFLASILIGIGVGLAIAAFMPKSQSKAKIDNRVVGAGCPLPPVWARQNAGGGKPRPYEMDIYFFDS